MDTRASRRRDSRGTAAIGLLTTPFVVLKAALAYARQTLHLISPMAVSSPAVQDVVCEARMDELTRRERERFKLLPVLPRFRPDTSSPKDITKRAVM